MGRKVSEVFLEFINPLLRQIMKENPKLTAKECEFQLRVPWMVWNALVMKKKHASGMDALSMLRTSLKDAPKGSKELVEILIERKSTHFSKYKYAIGNFEVRSIGDGDIRIAGGASTMRQALAAGAIEELMLDIVPVLLGRGERLFDGVEDPGLQPVEVIQSPYATHVRYRVGRNSI